MLADGADKQVEYRLW